MIQTDQNARINSVRPIQATVQAIAYFSKMPRDKASRAVFGFFCMYYVAIYMFSCCVMFRYFIYNVTKVIFLLQVKNILITVIEVINA